MKKSTLLFTLSISLLCPITWASEYTIPHSFVEHTPAVAAEVNENFTAVKSSVDDNNNRLETLETLIMTMQDEIDSLSSENTDLENRLAMVETNTVLELDGYLSYKDVNSYPTADFSGVNVRINNGTNTTTGLVNGLGNLTIGYNEPSNSTVEFCSDPDHIDQVSCEAVGEIWARNVRRGSHNLIIGLRNSYDNIGSILFGTDNIANADYASITAGKGNMVSGNYSIISGGRDNLVSGTSASISGGFDNIVSGKDSSITGGAGNSAFGEGTSITGGIYNETYDFFSSITGGRLNTSSGRYSQVTGGESNIASGESSVVSGGDSRSATGIDDWVSGTLFEDF